MNGILKLKNIELLGGDEEYWIMKIRLEREKSRRSVEIYEKWRKLLENRRMGNWRDEECYEELLGMKKTWLEREREILKDSGYETFERAGTLETLWYLLTEMKKS